MNDVFWITHIVIFLLGIKVGWNWAKFHFQLSMPEPPEDKK